jgi:hypothetical protein
MGAGRTAAVAAAALAGVLGGGGAALAASSSGTPVGGPISVLLQPSGTSSGGKILIAGAIGDYGTTFDVDRNGKTDPNGDFGMTKLTQGTFVVDLTALRTKAAGARPRFNATTCSAALTVSARVPIVSGSGTGRYKGISGGVDFTESFGFIVSRYTSGSKKGQCNVGAGATTVSALGVAAGSGTVSFG